jgi:outer membrane protein TolC
MNSMLEVQVAYYTLIAQIEQLKIARQSLQRAEVLMRNNEVRVRAGAMAPIELKVAQAEVATQRETVVVAENNVRNAERDLKRLLNVERLSIVGDTALVPVDFPKFEAKGIDEAYCLETALGKRPDFLAKKEELERQKVDVKFTRNGLYPQVDVIGSIQLNGLGGAFSDDLERLFSWEYPGVFVGLQMTIPLDGNRAAKASHAKAQLRAAQLLREMKRVELQIVTQVRNSVSNVSTNAQRIETTRVARELRQERLDSAEKLLEVGRITSFEVVTAQEDLAKAQLAELNSTIDYARSLATLSQQMGTILDELRIEVEEPPILR